MFFFKKKPLIFTSYISEADNGIFKFAPVIPSQKLIPEWWKQVSPGAFDWDTMIAEVNVKSCVGIINSFREGLILPLWCDLAIKTDESGWKYKYSDNKSEATVHKSRQAPGFYSNYYAFKLHSPWVMKCSEDGIKLSYSHPFYHFTEPVPYYTPPGIVSPVKRTYNTNVFLYIKKSDNEVILEHNTPLLQIIPLTDRNVQFKTEVVSPSEYHKLNTITGYRNVFFSKGVKRKLF
jgi:hypothetical protein